MLVLMAGVGYFFEFAQQGPSAREEILTAVALQMSPQMSEALGLVLAGLQERALVNGPLAGLGFLLTASVVFVQIDRGFMLLWDVQGRTGKKRLLGAARHMAVSRLRSLAMLSGTILLIVMVFLAGLVLRAASKATREWFPEIPMLPGSGALVIGIAANLLAFSLLYRFLSKEPVRWALCFKAGIVATLLWEGGSRLLVLASFDNHFSAYGIIGSFLVIQLWIFYNTMVLFAGALIVRLGTRPLDSRPP